MYSCCTQHAHSCLRHCKLIMLEDIKSGTAHLWVSLSAGAFLAEFSAELSSRATPLEGTSVKPVGGVLGAFASALAASSGHLSGDWSALPREDLYP